MLPIAARAGNDRNANAKEALDFMRGSMTGRHEGCVSTMLTESGLSIALWVRQFKVSVRPNRGCKPTSAASAGFFVLTHEDAAQGIRLKTGAEHFLNGGTC